jgi:hypothetical protein
MLSSRHSANSTAQRSRIARYFFWLDAASPVAKAAEPIKRATPLAIEPAAAHLAPTFVCPPGLRLSM